MQDLFDTYFSKSVPNNFITRFSNGTELWIKREDLLHPKVSGNKFRKLKYNLLAARAENKETLLTFGGAHSNHIAAVAAAGKMFRFKTIGIIRGEELEGNSDKWSSTLKYAKECGMNFDFITRQDYRNKDSEEFIQGLKVKFGDLYLLPEGGTNELAVKGCEEILKDQDLQLDYICASVGTGGTLAGLIRSSKENQKILGFSSLNTDYLTNEIQKMTNRSNWDLILKYHFGGYAKVNRLLIEFINDFYNKYKIKLDPIYTGKLLFGIFDLIKNNFFSPNTKILAIHTGGLQGIEGMNRVLEKKNLPQINE